MNASLTWCHFYENRLVNSRTPTQKHIQWARVRERKREHRVAFCIESMFWSKVARFIDFLFIFIFSFSRWFHLYVCVCWFVQFSVFFPWFVSRFITAKIIYECIYSLILSSIHSISLFLSRAFFFRFSKRRRKKKNISSASKKKQIANKFPWAILNPVANIAACICAILCYAMLCYVVYVCWCHESKRKFKNCTHT